MNSKQLVLDAIKLKEVERIPWVPFVGCHAASLIGTDAERYFKSEDLIVSGVEKANEMYQPDGLPILFDLQLEAEALGCSLKWAADNPPAVSSHPLAEGKTVADLRIPGPAEGRIPIAVNATKRIVRSLGDRIALYGLITGPYTLALHLRGTKIFKDMLKNPEEAVRIMEFCRDVCVKMAEYYMEAGADVIAIVDPMVSQISPKNFTDFVGPYCTDIYDVIRKAGKLCSLFVCGDATSNMEVMCQTKPDNISIDENIDLGYVKEIALKNGVSFGGNIRLTVTMLFGTVTDNIRDAMNCMEIGGRRGFILAPGCDMPFATPVKNVKAITSAVHGEIIDIVDDEDVMAGIEVTLPDYRNEKKVIIDVITLDSECCAACQYMWEAVNRAIEIFGDKVTATEYSVKYKESVARMKKLGVVNVPATCIDGDIVFISKIPDIDTLRDVIRKYMAAKNLA